MEARPLDFKSGTIEAAMDRINLLINPATVDKGVLHSMCEEAIEELSPDADASKNIDKIIAIVGQKISFLGWELQSIGRVVSEKFALPPSQEAVVIPLGVIRERILNAKKYKNFQMELDLRLGIMPRTSEATNKYTNLLRISTLYDILGNRDEALRVLDEIKILLETEGEKIKLPESDWSVERELMNIEFRRRTINAVIDAGPNSIAQAMSEMYHERDTGNAIQLCEKLLQRNDLESSNRMKTLIELALLYRRLWKYEKALEIYHELLSFQRENRLETRRTENTIRFFEEDTMGQVIRKPGKPTKGDLIRQIINEKDTNKAIGLCNEFLKRDDLIPIERGKAMIKLGALLRRAGRLEESLKVFREVIVMEEENNIDTLETERAIRKLEGSIRNNGIYARAEEETTTTAPATIVAAPAPKIHIEEPESNTPKASCGQLLKSLENIKKSSINALRQKCIILLSPTALEEAKKELDKYTEQAENIERFVDSRKFLGILQGVRHDIFENGKVNEVMLDKLIRTLREKLGIER